MKTIIKYAIACAVLSLVTGGALYAASRLDGKGESMPSQMDRADAYELKSIVLMLGEIEHQAKTQAEPLMRRRSELLAKYQVKADSDKIDLDKDVGKIVRAPVKAPSQPK
jgi:hypothetical protein